MRNLVHATLLILALSVGVFAQAKPTDVEIIPDVVYGHKDGLALTFDVFRPKSKLNGAAVIFMVSGGWVSAWAPPTQSQSRFQDLLDKGFTVIALRHGSSPKYLIPDVVADVRRAIRFIRYKSKDWGVDPNRLGVWGGSAGGHLSLMIGTASDAGDPNSPEPFLRESDRVAAVVAYFPPVDLRLLARGLNPAPTGTVLDRFPALNFAKERAADYSPIMFVSSDDPPTLLVHGDQDELVNISNSKIIYEALQKANVKTEFITIPGAGHGFRGEAAKQANAAMVSWFENTLLKKERTTQ